MSKIHTHYDNLKIAQNAPDIIIAAAHKALIENYQPTKFKGTKQQDAERISAIIQQSYEILIDATKRAEHDKWILEQEEKATLQELPVVEVVVEDDEINVPPRQTHLKHQQQNIFFNRSTAAWAMSLSVVGFVAAYGYSQYPIWLEKEKSLESTWGQLTQLAPNSDETVFRQANELAQQNRHTEALPLYQQLAEKGNVMAQNILGAMYEKGQGIAQNYELAAQWYQKAAQQGQAAAQYNLDLAQAKNQAVPKNPEEATQWYQKAAEKGEAAAQLTLGTLYEKGQGVPQNYTLAAQWYQKAADQENTTAQFNLGVLYEKGLGVPQNYSNAVQWYQKAAIQGNASAQFNLGVMYEKGQGVPQNYASNAQWYQYAAATQNENSQYADTAYIHAQITPQNYEAAVQWYQKAANQGLAVAQYNLGVMYQKGFGVPKNAVVAYSLFNLSAAIDAASTNPAIELRNHLVNEMSIEQIEVGQNLTQKMMNEKMSITKTIDQFMAMNELKR